MAFSRLLKLAVPGFLAGVVVLVFFQIETSMKSQGIASGGPYDNAASYPRAVAVLVGILVIVQVISGFIGNATAKSDGHAVSRTDLIRSGAMLVVFAVYLMVLTTLGYHLATAPMIFAIMWICGARRFVRMALASAAMALAFAFIFEKFLNVVLPLGLWNIFVPW